MGSKKKKDKDKERSGSERKKHKRDRERKGRDSDGSKRSRDRKDEGYEKEIKRRKGGEDEDELLSYALGHEQDHFHGSGPASEKESKPTGEDTSLSIDETNKIRAKLGLKPLVVESLGAGQMEKDMSSETSSINIHDPKNKDEEFVHAPPVNMLEKEKQEKYKEKLNVIREKREMHMKLQKVKKLAESDSDDDGNALSWVKKVRKKDADKILAEKRAKLLEEMDDEFGVGALVGNVMGKKPKAYTARDLKGLTVEHSSEMIKEGKAVVLTLKDSGVLEDSEDILMSVNILDTEKAEKNVELRKKKPAYQAYEEFDETGQQKVHGLLSKYDEEIDGEKKKTFSLSKGGSVNLTKEQELQKIRDRLHNQAVSLTTPEPQTTNEYYTEQEMMKFKKPKKRRKIKKREAFTADDLIPLHEQNDHGSRLSGGTVKKGSQEYTESLKDDLMEWQMGDPEDAEIRGPEVNDQEPLFDNDDAQLELQLALERSRRSKLKKKSVGAEKLVNAMTSRSNKLDENIDDGVTIVLDSTSEFCRTLGEIPTYGSSGNRPEVEEAEDDMEIEGEDEEQGGWEIVKQEAKKVTNSNEEPVKQDANVLDDEPMLGMGIGAALQLVQKKGMIEGDKSKERKLAGGLALPETVKIIDEEKMRDEERERLRERGRDRDRDRDRYNPNAFKEKAGYKPDVKLEYVDEHGRQMNPKEAFRYLSHKFHGKIPGKLKTEKRQKKISEDLALRKMNAGDTPLNTVALFTEKQKQGQTPYLILSGGGQTFSSGPTISKAK